MFKAVRDSFHPSHAFVKIMSVLIMFAVTCIMGCASSGVKYSMVKQDIAALSNDKGRIIFYRPNGPFGYAVRPTIFLNGNKVGISRPGTVFYVDVNPGEHQVTIPGRDIPGETAVDIMLSPHETIYVKNLMTPSAYVGRTSIAVVNPEKGMREIASLNFVTDPLK